MEMVGRKRVKKGDYGKVKREVHIKLTRA